jgi:hypothetical protein
MGEVINLNEYRKRRRREEAKGRAAETSASRGRTDRTKAVLLVERGKTELDGKRPERDPAGGGGEAEKPAAGAGEPEPDDPGATG